MAWYAIECDYSTGSIVCSRRYIIPIFDRFKNNTPPVVVPTKNVPNMRNWIFSLTNPFYSQPRNNSTNDTASDDPVRAGTDAMNMPDVDVVREISILVSSFVVATVSLYEMQTPGWIFSLMKPFYYQPRNNLTNDTASNDTASDDPVRAGTDAMNMTDVDIVREITIFVSSCVVATVSLYAMQHGVPKLLHNFVFHE